MAYAVINVTGKILNPDGLGVAGGRMEYGLDRVGTVDDGDTHMLLGRTVIEIGPTGDIDIDVISNDDIVPSGSRYNVLIVARDGTTYKMAWEIPNTPASQDIGGIIV